MLKKTKITKKTILITGASQGIGETSAIKFLNEGYNVGLIARNKKKLESNFKNFKNALILPCDVSNYDLVKKSFKIIIKKWGRLDVLFNNAGIGVGADTPDKISYEDWKKVIDINLNGSFICAKIAFKIMKDQIPQGGRIINNGSVSAHSPRPDTVAYTATKHAVNGLTKSIALDGRNFNISCSQLDIGNADTAIGSRFKSGVPQANGEVMVEPVFEAEDCGRAVAYIASLPEGTNILNMTIMATNMPFVGRG